MSFFTEYDTYIWGAFTLLGSWIFYKIIRGKEKSFSCRIENISVLWKAKPTSPVGLKILYDDIQVNYLEVITLRFSNTGSKSILGSDLISPIALHLEPNTKILSVNMESTSVRSKYTELPNSLEFTFDLMNPSDSLKIDITCDRESKLYITHRIIGITNINFPTEINLDKVLSILFALIFVPFCFFFLIHYISSNKIKVESSPLTFVLLLGVAIVAWGTLIWTLNNWKKVFIIKDVPYSSRITQNSVKV